MFWDSVQGGLKVLTYWETYVAAFIYQFVSLYLPMIVGLARMKKKGMATDDSPPIAGAILLMRKSGVILEGGPDPWIAHNSHYNRMDVDLHAGTYHDSGKRLLIILSLEWIATVIFMLTLIHIILGAGDDALWAWYTPWEILANSTSSLILIPVIALFLIGIGCLPYIGRIYSVHLFLLGCASVGFISANLGEASPNLFIDFDYLILVDFYPFLYLIGFYISGVVIFYVGTTLSIGLISLIQTIIFNGMTNKSAFEDILLLSPLMPVLQFIPVFMYGAYIGNQMYF